MINNSESTSSTNATRVWCLCFLCQFHYLSFNFGTIKKKSERILACYERVIDNIRQLNKLGGGGCQTPYLQMISLGLVLIAILKTKYKRWCLSSIVAYNMQEFY